MRAPSTWVAQTPITARSPSTRIEQRISQPPSLPGRPDSGCPGSVNRADPSIPRIFSNSPGCCPSGQRPATVHQPDRGALAGAAAPKRLHFGASGPSFQTPSAQESGEFPRVRLSGRIPRAGSPLPWPDAAPGIPGQPSLLHVRRVYRYKGWYVRRAIPADSLPARCTIAQVYPKSPRSQMRQDISRGIFRQRRSCLPGITSRGVSKFARLPRLTARARWPRPRPRRPPAGSQRHNVNFSPIQAGGSAAANPGRRRAARPRGEQDCPPRYPRGR